MRYAARRDRRRDYGIEHFAEQPLPIGAGCRDLICDVLGCGDIRSLPQVRHGPLHPESLSHIQHFAHIGRYTAQQFQRRPSAALENRTTLVMPDKSSTDIATSLHLPEGYYTRDLTAT